MGMGPWAQGDLIRDLQREERARRAEALRHHIRSEGAGMSDRAMAVMIAKIIQDEIGDEICTPELAEAAADRIECAIRNNPHKTNLMKTDERDKEKPID